MLSSEEIAEGKKLTKYKYEFEVLHEHDDCIRIAYEWLDAQKFTKSISRIPCPLKHWIEDWGGRYVSQSDVEVAVQLHPKIRGTYPYFNISRRLIRPSDARLANIGQTKTQDYKIRDGTKIYASAET